MKKIFSILMALFIVGIAQAQQAVATTPQQAITYFFDGLSELNDTKMRIRSTEISFASKTQISSEKIRLNSSIIKCKARQPFLSITTAPM